MQVIKQTLDPFWDQTLVFPAIDVHGMREHVKTHPPKVVLEAFDRDYCVSIYRESMMHFFNFTQWFYFGIFQMSISMLVYIDLIAGKRAPFDHGEFILMKGKFTAFDECNILEMDYETFQEM